MSSAAVTSPTFRGRPNPVIPSFVDEIEEESSGPSIFQRISMVVLAGMACIGGYFLLLDSWPVLAADLLVVGSILTTTALVGAAAWGVIELVNWATGFHETRERELRDLENATQRHNMQVRDLLAEDMQERSTARERVSAVGEYLGRERPSSRASSLIARDFTAAKLLIRMRGDLNKRDEAGFHLLEKARGYPNVYELLVRHGARGR